MRVTLKGFERCRVLHAVAMEAMRPMSDMEIELSGNRLQVWVANLTTGQRFLCAEAVIPNSTPEASETSGLALVLIPSALPPPCI